MKIIQVCDTCEGTGEIYTDYDEEVESGHATEECPSCAGEGSRCTTCGLPESECECDGLPVG